LFDNLYTYAVGDELLRDNWALLRDNCGEHLASIQFTRKMCAASSAAEWCALMKRSVDAGRTALLQLATLSSDGRPTVRTVVFRGWASGSALRFVTDLRSAKVRNGRLDWAEACYYSADTREQFRLTGPLSVLGPDAIGSAADVRRKQWAELSDSARAQFCWPEPGAPRASDDQFEPELPIAIEAVEHFAVLLLKPKQVDHYCSKQQSRDVYREQDDGTWTCESVNP
jgi:pyridoxamine 5'-phosphate oxidase